MDGRRCASCERAFSPAELELASDGSGLFCAPCKIRREAPDLAALFRKDARRRGAWMIVLGSPVFAFGAYLLYFVWQAYTSPNPFLGSARIGRPATLAVGAIVFGGAAVLVGVQTLLGARKKT